MLPLQSRLLGGNERNRADPPELGGLPVLCPHHSRRIRPGLGGEEVIIIYYHGGPVVNRTKYCFNSKNR